MWNNFNLMAVVIFWIPHKFGRDVRMNVDVAFGINFDVNIIRVASVAFSLPSNCVWALTINWPNSPNPKKTAFEEFVIAVVWNCTTKCICNHSVTGQASADTGEGGVALKWWGVVITMAHSMGFQRLKKKQRKRSNIKRGKRKRWETTSTTSKRTTDKNERRNSEGMLRQKETKRWRRRSKAEAHQRFRTFSRGVTAAVSVFVKQQ